MNTVAIKEQFVDKTLPSGDLIFNKPVRNTLKPLTRSESCFIHDRLCNPEMEKVNRQARIIISKGVDGDIKLEKHPFGSLLV